MKRKMLIVILCCLGAAMSAGADTNCSMDSGCYFGNATYRNCIDICQIEKGLCNSSCDDTTWGPCAGWCKETPSECGTCVTQCKTNCNSNCFWCTNDCYDRWCFQWLGAGGPDDLDTFLEQLRTTAL